LLGNYRAAVVGMAMCFLYQAGVMSLLGLEAVGEPGSYIVTGLLVGRGANFVHDFAKTYLVS
jgi:hypothetical protein